MNRIISNLEWEVPHPKKMSAVKMVNFNLAIIKLWMHENGIFLGFLKYTLVCRMHALAVFGCTTLYHVS